VSNQITIRKGTEEQRLQTIFANGEPVLCTDSLQVYIGDGVTRGGRPIRTVDMPYLRSAYSYRFNEEINVATVFGALDKIYNFMNNLSNNVYYGDLNLGTLPTNPMELAAVMSALDMVQTGPQGNKDLPYVSNYTYRTIIYPQYFGLLATIQDPMLNYLDISSTYNAVPEKLNYNGTAFYVYITKDPLLNQNPKNIRYSFAYGATNVLNGEAAPAPLDPTIKVIHQENHDFPVGAWLVRAQGLYILADASSEFTSDVIGVVTRIVSPDDFIMTITGYITGLSGLIDGYTYFLSATAPGTLSTTPPTAPGSIDKPIFVADSSTTGFLINQRGVMN
jgi:hypothetical protein